MVDDRDDSGLANERSRSFGKGAAGSRGSRNMIQPDAVAKPPTRSSAVRNPFVVAGNAIFVLLMLIAIGGYFGLRQFTSPGPLSEAKTVYGIIGVKCWLNRGNAPETGVSRPSGERRPRRDGDRRGPGGPGGRGGDRGRGGNQGYGAPAPAPAPEAAPAA